MDKPGRNDPCPCGSGKKYKKCCELKAPRKKLGSAQILSGTQKMSSLFNRSVTPITPVAPPEKPKEETPADPNTN